MPSRWITATLTGEMDVSICTSCSVGDARHNYSSMRIDAFTHSYRGPLAGGNPSARHPACSGKHHNSDDARRRETPDGFRSCWNEAEPGGPGGGAAVRTSEGAARNETDFSRHSRKRV